MLDAQFEKLDWNGLSEVWATSVALPYFHDFGKNLAPDPEAQHDGAGVAETDAEPELTQGQIKAREALQAQLATLPVDQRAIMESMIAAVQGGIGAGGFVPPQPSAEDEDPLDPDQLFRQGRFLLEIETGGSRKLPSLIQRQAWARLQARGDALWDEMMKLLLQEYQLQQPVRARWWKAVYGDFQIQRALPEVTDVEGLKDLLRPTVIRIRRTPRSTSPVEMEVHFTCTWHSDPLEVLVGDGKPPELQPGSVMPWESSPKQKFQHPVFGLLGKQAADSHWAGSIPCDPFRDYQALVADQRASFRSDPESHGPPKSQLRWDFVHGLFDLRVHAPAGKRPTPEQAEALRRFKEDEARNAAVIIQAVFEHYQAVYEDARGEYMDRHLKENVPEPTSVDLLHDRLQLLEVDVFPPVEGGKGKLGFLFLCSWDPGTDLGIRWCDGQVEAIGGRAVGRP